MFFVCLFSLSFKEVIMQTRAVAVELGALLPIKKYYENMIGTNWFRQSRKISKKLQGKKQFLKVGG